MVWKSCRYDLRKQNLIVVIPANFFKKTLIVDLAVYLQQKCFNDYKRFSSTERSNFNKK